MNRIRFTETAFKGEPAVLLDNGIIRAVVLPRRGAKTASLALLSRAGEGVPAGESLAQPETEAYQRPVHYGMEFAGEDGTGFDDLFPTIAPCTLQEGPWRGIELPDHGEVWTLPWECAVREGALVCSVHGLRLPYSLEKSLRLEGNSLIVSYRAQNHAPFALPFQWAAHAILDISPGAKLIVPEDPGMKRIVNAYPGNRLPEVHREYNFPCPDPGTDFDLSVMPERNDTGAQKYWFAEPVAEGRCGLYNPRSGLTTTLRFSPERLPYLGIWVSEGGWNGCYNMGIEPSTCMLDDPVTAAERGRGSQLPPRGAAEWELSIELEAQPPLVSS